jgi:hypothetical protein
MVGQSTFEGRRRIAAVSITRRAFVQGAMLGACAMPAWTLSRLGGLRVDEVIFDARRCHALAFADAARRLGATTRALCGDASHREYRALFARSQSARTAVAGLTDFRSLFFLQMLAADAGLHPILRIHHRSRDAIDTHEAFGTRSYRTVANASFARRGDSWAREAAYLVLNLPARELDAMRHTDNLCEANSRVLASRAMVTWVMA